MKSKIIILLIVLFTISACVQSRTMVTHRATDNVMSCGETAQRIGELDAIKKLTLKEKNTKSAVAGILFFPAISGNRANARDTINAVNARKQVLGDIYQTNECVTDIPIYSVEQIKRRIDNNQVLELQQ